jgi:hypothetical protein
MKMTWMLAQQTIGASFVSLYSSFFLKLPRILADIPLGRSEETFCTNHKYDEMDDSCKSE